MLTIHLSSRIYPGQPVQRARLNLVDLAGSERLKLSRESSTRGTVEASHVNKSLSALSHVLQALSDGETHVPYRDSPLTKLLMETFESDNTNIMIACVSPAQSMVEESLNTLHFAKRAH